MPLSLLLHASCSSTALSHLQSFTPAEFFQPLSFQAWRDGQAVWKKARFRAASSRGSVCNGWKQRHL